MLAEGFGMRRSLVLLLALALTSTETARAGQAEESPLGGAYYFVGASAGIPTSRSADVFKVGPGVTLGVGYRFTERFSAQVDYLFSSYGLKSDLIEQSDLTGSQRLQWSTLDASYELLPPDKIISVRILAGPAIYWRRVSIEEISGVELVTFCSPYTFFCFPSPTPTTTVLGSRSSSDFGFNAGLKLGVSLGYPTQLYLESRFHFIYGPQVETESGTRRANGYFLPVILGFNYF